MKWTYWILYAICCPWDFLVAWPIVLAIRVLWGEDLRWETPKPYDRKKGGGGGPCLTCRIREGSFPVRSGTFPKGWYLRKGRDGAPDHPWGGTTLGHGIFYGPNGRKGKDDEWTRTQVHEHFHVEQGEAAMVQAFLVALATAIVLWALGHPVAGTAVFLTVWTLGYLLNSIGGWLAAALRGEEAYWGSTHEESARAQTDKLRGRDA